MSFKSLNIHRCKISLKNDELIVLVIYSDIFFYYSQTIVIVYVKLLKF